MLKEIRTNWLYWLILLSLAVGIFALAGCNTGDDDDDSGGDDEDQWDKNDDDPAADDHLVRAQDCDQLLTFFQNATSYQMNGIIDQLRSYWDGGGEDYWDDDDDWWDDDTTMDDDDDDWWDDDDDVSDDDFADDDDVSPTDDDDATDDDNGDDDDDDDHSDTNVQEEGVDEPDLTKTDGDYLYITNGGFFLIFDVDPEDQTAEVGRLPIEGKARDMFLYGDYALVYSVTLASHLSADIWPGLSAADLYNAIVKFTIIDHSDKANPVVIREFYAEGELLTARRIASTVRTVIRASKGGPELELSIDPWNYSSEQDYQDELTRMQVRNEQAIMSAPLEDWVPRYYDIVYGDSGTTTDEGLLAECTDHYLPGQPQGTADLAIVLMDFENPTQRSGDIALVADGQVVYGSSTNLYVAGTLDNARAWGLSYNTSQIHQFALDDEGGQTLYVASGTVDGFVINQFAMSEYEGFLRAATTDGPQGNTNAVFVLKAEGDDLVIMGQLNNIGDGEDLYAARFMGGKGFMVTYRQTDPLWTLDMSDPYNPTLVGELWVPGFSTYLHPMDEDHLLAIGENGDEWSADGGVALAIYDVSDFANPVQTHLLDLGDWGVTSQAKYDHHAFLYYSPDDLLAIPLADGAFTGVYAMECTTANGFTLLAQIDHAAFTGEAGSNPYSGQNVTRRSVVISDYLFTVSDLGLIVSDQNGWSEIVEIDLPWQD